MAIEDYFVDIIVLFQLDKTSNMLGGLDEDWQETVTIRGVINQKSSQQSIVGGKSNQETYINGYFEITDDTTNYLIPENRIKYDDKIYRIIGKQKNTVNRNNHYKVDLIYLDHVESS